MINALLKNLWLEAEQLNQSVQYSKADTLIRKFFLEISTPAAF